MEDHRRQNHSMLDPQLCRYSRPFYNALLPTRIHPFIPVWTGCSDQLRSHNSDVGRESQLDPV